MTYLLVTLAAVCLFIVAPLKVALATYALGLLIAATVMGCTRAVAGVNVSFGEAIKAVGLSLAFLGIATFTLISFTTGTGVSQFTGISAVVVLTGFFVAYVLAFKLSLGTSFGASAVVAVISTVISGVLYWLLRSAL